MTRPVDYDAVAGRYDRRYALQAFGGVREALLDFVQRPSGDAAAADVLEVGCGTGHWLAELAGVARSVAGIDPSSGMLAGARAAAPGALLARARAEAIPWRSESVDRVFAINALHHFGDAAAFVREARRVLRSGGGLLVIGLDPHTGLDQWWIWEHFPAAHAADLARYPPAARIRATMEAAGFVGCAMRVAQHLPAAVSVRAAEARGLLARDSTSQLMVIDDEAYRAGLARVRALGAAPGDAEPMLRADLRLWATEGWVPSA